MKKKKCNVCDHEATIFQVIDNCRFGQYILQEKSFTTQRFQANLYKCKNCSHISLDGVDNSEFYNEAYSEWQGAQGYYGDLEENSNDKIKKVYEYLNTKSKKDSFYFLDIGCGTGNHMLVAKRYFEKVFGVEPSENAAIAAEKGFDVIKDYFCEKTSFNHKVKAFSAFQVLEHVKTPKQFMLTLFDRVEPGGVGIINVPNGKLIIESCMYDQIISEHENYFTIESLIYLSHAAGFEILEINNDRKSLELDLYIKKPTPSNKNTRFINTKKEDDANLIQEKLRNNPNIGIWGAGQKTLSYSQLLPKNRKIKYLFDNDSSKWGYFISDINLPIEKPSKEKVNSCDVIIIFASSYYPEIAKILRDQYCFAGKITVIESGNIHDV